MTGHPIAVTTLCALLALPQSWTPPPELPPRAPAAAASNAPPTVEQLIRAAAARHGVSAATLLRVAACESRLRPWVTSRSGHMGLYQFSARTWHWMSAAAGWAGASPYDPAAAAEVAAYAFGRGWSGHWSCR